MKCLVLAGGFGTRLYPLTINRAKSLLEYKGKPLLTHIIDKVPQDIDILVATNKRFEAEFLRWRKGIGRHVDICVEAAGSEAEKKGAVGALYFWLIEKKIDEDLLVVAGDNYFGFDLTKFIAVYDGNTALIAVHDIDDIEKATQFGVVKLEGNKVIEFEEKPTKPKTTLVATAIYIFPPRVFHHLARFCTSGRTDNLGSFISYLVDTDEVHAYVFAEPWLDIGSKRG